MNTEMKRIIYIICGLAALVSASSCSDFLDRYPYDKVDPETEVVDSMAVALTNACYKTLQSSNMYNMRLWSLDIIAGNSQVGAGGGTDGLETIQAANFTLDSSSEFALYVWRSPWVGIHRCNIVLQNLPDADIDEDLKNRSMGEAYFLRAHYYFILARLFGGVPLRLEPYDPGSEEGTAIARNTKEEVYEQIISDCRNAIALLPAKGEYSALDLGRASKDAAMTMLADVYLTLAVQNPAHYEEVVNLCNQVAQLGYDLSSCSYEDNFNALIDNGEESIFEVQYSGSTEYDFWGTDCQSSWLSTFMGPRNSGIAAGCYGWNLPTQEFMDQWEEGDLRKDVSVFYPGCPAYEGTDYKASWSMTGYNVRKFMVSKSASPEFNTSPANFVVYRFAKVLMMKAEALCEQGKLGEAAGVLNIVRNRAGLPSVSADTQEELREMIIHENRMEFAFEGHRWYDLIRVNNGEYAIEFLHSIGKTNVNRNRLLFPIPQAEMDANPLMVQNQGY